MMPRVKLYRDSFHTNSLFIYFIWPHSINVPMWAWKIAGKCPQRFRISCWGQFENSLSMKIC